jgi:hypothetical protein
MKSIHRGPPRDLRKALIALAVAIAALASAIVLVLIPQPFPYPSQAPLACNSPQAHQAPEVVMARHASGVSTSTADIPNSPCA